MKKSTRSFYKKVITESVFILFGILVAFLIDKWWDNSQENKSERQRLRAVREELIEEQKRLAEYDVFYSDQSTLIRSILEEAERREPSYRRLDTLLLQLGPFEEYVPSLVAYDDAVQGGNLSRIEPIKLRHALAGYKLAMEHFVEFHVIIRNHFDTKMGPLWSEYINVRRHLDTNPAFLESMDGLPNVSFESRYDKLIKEYRFSNHLIERGIYLRNLKKSEETVKERMDTLLKLLEPYQ